MANCTNVIRHSRVGVPQLAAAVSNAGGLGSYFQLTRLYARLISFFIFWHRYCHFSHIPGPKLASRGHTNNPITHSLSIRSKHYPSAYDSWPSTGLQCLCTCFGWGGCQDRGNCWQLSWVSQYTEERDVCDVACSQQSRWLHTSNKTGVLSFINVRLSDTPRFVYAFLF